MRKKCRPLQNILRVSRMFQWNPAVMLCAYVILNMLCEIVPDSPVRACCCLLYTSRCV